MNKHRRDLLLRSAAGVVLLGCATTGRRRSSGSEEASSGAEEEAEVTPGEDLMQEHALLDRILLIYDEASRRIEQREALDIAVIHTAAGIVHSFIEDYHERMEEQFVFPRLQKAGRESELVAVLLRQHERGRQLTAAIREKTQTGTEMASALSAFVRMYRPHAAREGSVLFPAFREVVGGHAYGELGEQFEAKEHELFGKDGFEKKVEQVAKLEAALGIGNLDSFT